MRIPLFIAIPASLLTVALIWWTCTRHMDFLTPPSEAQLAAIREEALASLPVSIVQDDAISIKVPIPETPETDPDPEPVVEPVDLGDFTSPPVLDTYSNRAPEGADKLIALAMALENAGAFQRSLLAYERVLDLSQGNPEQFQTAITEIQRLRPTLANWNTDEAETIHLVVHIGTGEKFAEILPEILDRVMRDLHNASSGILDFTYNLNIGRSIQTTDAPTPVAVWITGTGDGRSFHRCAFLHHRRSPSTRKRSPQNRLQPRPRRTDKSHLLQPRSGSLRRSPALARLTHHTPALEGIRLFPHPGAGRSRLMPAHPPHWNIKFGI